MAKRCFILVWCFRNRLNTLNVIPGKLAIVSATRNPGISRLLDAAFASMTGRQTLLLFAKLGSAVNPNTTRSTKLFTGKNDQETSPSECAFLSSSFKAQCSRSEVEPGTLNFEHACTKHLP